MSSYIAKIKYKCGHIRTRYLKSKLLAGKRYRDIDCLVCGIKKENLNNSLSPNSK